MQNGDTITICVIYRKGAQIMPYQKYGDWYIPECRIRFPTESEAWEYISENANEE